MPMPAVRPFPARSQDTTAHPQQPSPHTWQQESELLIQADDAKIKSLAEEEATVSTENARPGQVGWPETQQGSEAPEHPQRHPGKDRQVQIRPRCAREELRNP